MKQKEIDLSVERNILIGLIISKDFTKQIINSIDVGFFKVNFTKIICKWCIDYWNKYTLVPGKSIIDIFKLNSKTLQNDSILELIENFLDSISGEYERADVFNIKYWLEQAEKYFRKQKLEQLQEKFGTAVEQDDVDGAERFLSEFKEMKFTQTGGTSVVKDNEILKRVFAIEEKEEELFRLPKEIGKLLGAFHRGDLIAVEGPAKRGKSFWLIELAITAFKHKLKVLFISLEMNERQVMFRMFQNLLGRPKNDSEISFPKFVEGDIVICSEDKKGLSYETIHQKRKQLLKQYGAGDIHLVCYPSNSIKVQQIKNYIDSIEVREGFLPDVVVIDYADLITASYRNEYRHQLDDIWKNLRGIAQEKNCLVITASHTNKQTFDRDIRQGDTSEDSRKKNHVSVMFALNQRGIEKDKRVMRVRVTAHRHELFGSGEVAVTNCLEIGKAILDSKKVSDIKFYETFFKKRGK